MKRRHVPMRMCVGCQAMKPKREMLRIVRTPDGEILLDPTGKKSGRGAYVCPDQACLDKAVKARRLEKALGKELSSEILGALRRQVGGDSGPGGPC
ncbi:MAG: YlxR family protein [Bacillota bacterium]